ncbi:MAG: FRG domain-containing protein [Lachnospiraceae bacterium]
MDYYCNMEKYIHTSLNRKEYQKMLEEQNSLFAGLYKAYPSLEYAEEYWENYILAIQNEYSENMNELSFAEAEAIVYWIYRLYGTIPHRKMMTRKSLEVLECFLDAGVLGLSGEVIYLTEKADVIPIETFTKFCDAMNLPEEENHTLFYRGHASASYKLLPAVMRKEAWTIHENDMYNELKINCAGDFSDCRTHLDYLVEMQHYGLPTRLMDVTRNPLVALYFACESEPDKSGEIIVFDIDKRQIRYPGSDLVSIMASLPLMSYKKKKEMMGWLKDKAITDKLFNDRATAFLHEIKLEKPAFENRIRKKDVKGAVVVLSEKKNNRIIKQDGAFIICGLFDENSNPINELRYKENGKRQVFIITQKAKAGILKQLDKFSVNQAALFPEIEDVAEYIKTKY